MIFILAGEKKYAGDRVVFRIQNYLLIVVFEECNHFVIVICRDFLLV